MFVLSGSRKSWLAPVSGFVEGVLPSWGSFFAEVSLCGVLWIPSGHFMSLSEVVGAGFGFSSLLPRMSCWPCSSSMMYDRPSSLF